MWNTIKLFFRYRRHVPHHTHQVHPVRVDGKPAKHLEVSTTLTATHVHEGWFRPRRVE